MANISRRTGSRRRTISEINMVPFIDVMLVLLIIFMVSAPLITTGLVDLPSVGKSRQRADGLDDADQRPGLARGALRCRRFPGAGVGAVVASAAGADGAASARSTWCPSST